MIESLKKVVSKSAALKAVSSYIIFKREARVDVFRSNKLDYSGPVIFTTHKCASTFVTEAFKVISSNYALRPYNFAGFYWNLGYADVYGKIEKERLHLFGQSNAIYGPLRSYVNIPSIESRSVVLVLRDPRDVLVSAYYSLAYSHALPGGAQARAQYLERRRRVQSMGIDDFVLDAIGQDFIAEFSIYAEHLLPLEHVTFLSYEDLIENPLLWCKRFVEGLNLPDNADVTSQLVKAFENGGPSAGQNDIKKHRRNGSAGQYLTALKPETILKLNAMLRKEIEAFGCWPI